MHLQWHFPVFSSGAGWLNGKSMVYSVSMVVHGEDTLGESQSSESTLCRGHGPAAPGKWFGAGYQHSMGKIRPCSALPDFH